LKYHLNSFMCKRPLKPIHLAQVKDMFVVTDDCQSVNFKVELVCDQA
jgi:hypothetical protein